MALRPHKEEAGFPSAKASDLPLSLAAAESIVGRRRAEDFRWRYEDGLALYAVAEAGERRSRPDLSLFAEAAMRHLVAPDGSILAYRQDEYNLDQVNPGKLLFSLGRKSGDPRYAIAADALRRQLSSQPRCPSGGFWHKGIYPNQMWLDGLFMAAPFYLEYSLVHGDGEGIRDVRRQFGLAEGGCLDEATGLLRHAWNETRSEPWADPGTGRSPNSWGRAMGWYCMALVDCIALIDRRAGAGAPGTAGSAANAAAAAEARDAMRDTLKRTCASVLRFADPGTGLWWQVLDSGGREGNYLETSASAMFVYAFARGVSSGCLDAAVFAEAARKAWASMVSRNVSRAADGLFSLAGICSVAGLGGKPYRDGTYQYYLSEPVVSDDYTGVGPFILAALEMEDLEGDAPEMEDLE
jgi:unsaturated rhamnogalacturonyl hydrolase